MNITKLALKFALKVPKIDEFDSYLFIGPHPDDIEIGAGATVATLAQMGKKITILVCTDGRFGDGYSDGVKGDALAEMRKKEAIASAAALGVKDIRFLNLHDGAGYTIEELEKGIAQVMGEVKPDMVFAPDPDAKSECHQDHLNVGKAVRKWAFFAPFPGIMNTIGAEAAPVKALAYYMTARPNRYFATKGNKAKQLSALLDNHKSQLPEGCPDRKSFSTYITLRSLDFGLRSFHWKGAEGFRVYSQAMMHCVPETGE